MVFQRAAVSHAALSGKLLLCHLVRTSKNVEAINFWFVRHGIIYYYNRAAARPLWLQMVFLQKKTCLLTEVNQTKPLHGINCARNLLKPFYMYKFSCTTMQA